MLKTYNTSNSLSQPPTGSWQVARGACICETGLVRTSCKRFFWIWKDHIMTLVWLKTNMFSLWFSWYHILNKAYNSQLASYISLKQKTLLCLLSDIAHWNADNMHVIIQLGSRLILCFFMLCIGDTFSTYSGTHNDLIDFTCHFDNQLQVKAMKHHQM